MGVLVNIALGALAGVIGGLLGASVLGSKFALPVGILTGLVGYFLGGALAPPPPASKSSASDEYAAEDSARKAQKKAKKAAAEQKKKEEALAERQREAEAKAAQKKAEKKAAEAKKAKGGKAAPVAVVESDADSDAESETDAAPKSKSAIKKAKKAAKEAAAKKEAEAAAKAAAKKGGKKGEAAPAPVAAAPKAAAAAKSTPAQDKAAKAAAAAAAADLEGWETIEATKPTKSQLAKAQQVAAAPAPVKKGKTESTPASERLLTEELIIPIKQHPLIIGTAGATLKKLQEGSGATIDMPKRDSASSKIQITGTPAQVHAAKNAIQSLSDRGFSAITHPGILSDDITVEPTQIGLILGNKGGNLKKLQEVTKARINLPEKGSSSKKITIVGEKEAVKAAKAALRSLITDGFSSITHEGFVKVEIQFPAEKFGILIGPKGQTIKSIQGNTKTRINLPEKNSKSTTVSVVGLPAGVAQAEKEIARLLEPLAPLPDPEEEDLATDDAWGQAHTAQGEDALWE